MRATSVLSLTILLGALGACAAEKPKAPLMSPVSQVTDFGYSNRDLANNRIEVTYLGPSRRVSTWRASRQEAVDEAKAQAEELATWRAAQVALDKGKPAFQVVDKHTDVEVDVRDYYEPYPSAWYPYPYPYGWARGPFYPLYPPYYGTYRDAYAQAQSKLTVQLLDKMQPGALDARETADRLGKKYSPPPAPKPDAQKPAKENT
jgi:hypothetical protein